MAQFVLIPFLLAMTVTPDRPIDEMHFEYTFQVYITSQHTQPRYGMSNETHLSMELTCHDAPDGLMCRVGSYKLLDPVPMELPASRQSIYANRIIERDAFDKNSEPFLIKFSSKGIDGYVIEQEKITKRMMNVYRMIGEQLNIGAEIQGKGDNFQEFERTYIGSCSAIFQIGRLRYSTFNLNINMTSLVGLSFKDNTMTIVVKRRLTSGNDPLTNYSFSARFWPELVPGAALYHGLNESVSSLTMASNGMQSLTINSFNVYNIDGFVIGDVTEIVKLELTSYRELSPDRIITLDKKKTVLVNAYNDNNV